MSDKYIRLGPKGSFILTIIIGIILLCSISIPHPEGGQWILFGLIPDTSCSYIPWSYTILSFFVISLLCGGLYIHLINIKKPLTILAMSFLAGSVTMICYVFLTLLISWRYIFSPPYHYYPPPFGDLFFGSIILLIYYSIFIIPGFLIGGFFPTIYKKINTKRKM